MAPQGYQTVLVLTKPRSDFPNSGVGKHSPMVCHSPVCLGELKQGAQHAELTELVVGGCEKWTLAKEPVGSWKQSSKTRPARVLKGCSEGLQVAHMTFWAHILYPLSQLLPTIWLDPADIHRKVGRKWKSLKGGCIHLLYQTSPKSMGRQSWRQSCPQAVKSETVCALTVMKSKRQTSK